MEGTFDRVQSVDRVGRVTETARSLGFHGVSFDLIYVLPQQTVESFMDTVDTVRGLGRDRISFFSYAHVPWKKKHQRMIDEAWLPAPREKIRIFVEAVERLAQQYRVIGMDHFALPDDSLSAALEEGSLHRNFQGYSTYANAELVGLGLSSISQFRGAHAQNVLDLKRYYEALEGDRFATARGYRLTKEDRLRRDVISSVMCGFELDIDAIRREHDIDFWMHFSDARPQLRTLEDDGLVVLRTCSIRITETGRFFVRNVAMVFDAYQGVRSPGRPLYSQTV